MDKPKFFKHTQLTESVPHAKTGTPTGKSFRTIFLAAFFLIIMGYVGYKGYSFASHMSRNWQEIAFAYNKPQLVKKVRVEYEQKETALEQEMQSGKPDQQLLDQVKKTVQDELQQQQKQASSFR